MEKIVVTPDKDGKYIIKLFGTEYEIVISKPEKPKPEKETGK